MFASLHTQGASAVSTGHTIDDLLGNPAIRRDIASAMRGSSTSSSGKAHSLGTKLDLNHLKTVLPEMEALTYNGAAVWSTINPQYLISHTRPFDDGTTVIYISFASSNASSDTKRYQALDSKRVWRPLEHKSRSNHLLADFFATIATDRTHVQLNYNHAVLAMYLQDSIWKIIDTMAAAPDTLYRLVFVGHGPEGALAQLLAIMYHQRIREEEACATAGGSSPALKAKKAVYSVVGGSPMAFKYAAAAHVRNVLGDRVRVFGTPAAAGGLDPFLFYPPTCFAGSTEVVGPFDWETEDAAHDMARGNNIWTQVCNVIPIAPSSGADAVLRGITTNLARPAAYASALEAYVPAPSAPMGAKAMTLTSAASASGATAASVFPDDGKTPPAATGSGTTDGAAADATSPVLPPPATGAGDSSTDGWGWPASLGNFLGSSGSAPAPAALPLPPAFSDLGEGGGSAAAALPPATGGLTSTLSAAWSAGCTGLGAASGAISSKFTAAAEVGSSLLGAAAKSAGKVVFSRDIARQTAEFTGYQAFFHRALTDNREAFIVLDRDSATNPIAKAYAAILLAFGSGVAPDLHKATQYATDALRDIENSAYYDVPAAKVLLGYMLEIGLGTTAKYSDANARQREARRLYEEARAAEVPEAYYRLGELERTAGNFDQAIDLFTTAGGRYEHPNARNSLGELYYQGKGLYRALPLAKRLEEAHSRFLAVKDQSPAAKYNLAHMYDQLEIPGTSPDDSRTEAKKLSIEAADQGHKGARALLGSILYAEGDYANAQRHFQMVLDAATVVDVSRFPNGFTDIKTAAAEANFQLYLMHTGGHTTSDGRENLEQAAVHLEAARKLGDVRATVLASTKTDAATTAAQATVFYEIGDMYYRGKHAPLNLQIANKFFRRLGDLSSAQSYFASAVVRLEILGASLPTAPTASMAATAPATLRETMVGGAGARTAPPPSLLGMLGAALSAPPSAAQSKAASTAPAISARFEPLPSVSTEILGLLHQAQRKGCAAAATLLAHIEMANIQKVATEIYVRQKRGPRMDPFAAAM